MDDGEGGAELERCPVGDDCDGDEGAAGEEEGSDAAAKLSIGTP